ncbi:MAG: hypothetical protein ABSA41_08815 [Terriglobia bacterium]|jgi:hypothetical protein
MGGIQEFHDSSCRAKFRNHQRGALRRGVVGTVEGRGAAPARNAWIFFGSCAGSPDFEAYVENLIGILEGAKQKMLNFGLLDARTYEESVAALRDWKHRPDAAIWFAMAWTEGVRRE